MEGLQKYDFYLSGKIKIALNIVLLLTITPVYARTPDQYFFGSGPSKKVLRPVRKPFFIKFPDPAHQRLPQSVNICALGSRHKHTNGLRFTFPALFQLL